MRIVLLMLLIVLTACRSGDAPPEESSANPLPAATGAATPAVPANTPATGAVEQPPTSADSAAEPTAPPSPTLTQTAVPTETPPPTATPRPALQQLTTGGCCVNPGWTADSQAIRFIDRPSPDQPAGIYTVPISVSQPVAAGTLLTTEFLDSSPTGRYSARLEDGVNRITDLTTGATWTVETANERITFAPDETRIAWQVRELNDAIPFDQRQSRIWIANIDGTNPQAIASVMGGGLNGWLPDGRLLWIRRLDATSRLRVLEIFDPRDGSSRELFRAERLNGVSLAPGGRWALLSITFERDQPDLNGFWIVPTDGAAPRKLAEVGAFRWRDSDRLLLIPLELGAPSHRLIQIDAATGNAQPLTDPTALAFRVTNNDWAVAPNGQAIVFVSATDTNLYLLNLPSIPE